MFELVFYFPILFALVAVNSNIVDKMSGGKAELEMLPKEYIFPPKLADNRDVGVSQFVINQIVKETHVEKASLLRYNVAVGTHIKIARLKLNNRANDVIQVNLGASLYQEYDPKNKVDIIGWDGTFESNFTWGKRESRAHKFGFKHLSGHIGDEYLIKTNRERFRYARDELLYSIHQMFAKKHRVYFKTGYAIHNAAYDGEKRVKFQTGYEYKTPRNGGSSNYYTALDLKAGEETNWNLNSTLQSGIMFNDKHHNRFIRLGGEVSYGDVPVTEVSFHREMRVSIGMWLNL